MAARFAWRAAPPLAMFLIFVSGLRHITAGEPPARSDAPEAQVIDVFAAMKTNLIEVQVSARNSRRLTLQMTNTTDRPLHVRMPEALAAVPVVAQFFPAGPVPGGIPRGGQRRDDPLPQQLGFPGIGNLQQGNPLNNGQNGNFPPGGLFNVPPEKTIRVKLPCVCLEHGKPDPRPRDLYTIEPLKSAPEREQLAQVLALLGEDRCGQREAQAAAWHLASRMSWKELAKLRIEHLAGISEPFFQQAEIKKARRMVERLSGEDVSSPAPQRIGSYRRAETGRR